MATFDLNDDSIVCIVGSGAGGGTLGNELAQKGIKVVILEAGDKAEATTTAHADPYAEAGVFQEIRVFAHRILVLNPPEERT